MINNNPTQNLLGNNYNKIHEDIIQYNKIFFGGDTMNSQKYLSTGNEVLDDLLHGGYKKGALTEISGATDTGKTLLALKAIKELQKEDKIAIYVDASCQLQTVHILENNLNEDGIIVVRPTSIEQLAVLLSEIVKTYIDNIGLIIIDSLADLSTKHEQESKLSANTDLHRSKVIKALLTRISNLVRNSEACAIILNQDRNNFDNETPTVISTSERWINMACDTRLHLSLDEDDEIYVEVSFKNKLTK